MNINTFIAFLISFSFHLMLIAQVQIGPDIDGETANDQSGFSVALSSDGDRLAVGATLNDGNGTSAGHVRVFDLVGGSWIQVGADIDGEADNDESGRSVCLSSDGNRVAFGAINNDGNGISSGHVRVYDLINGSWTQVGADIDGEAAGDESGRSVCMSSDGNRIAVGAHFNNGNGSFSGHVRIYDLLGGSWTQVGGDIDGEAANDQSGVSLALSANGNRVAIGAVGNDDNGTSSGHVRIYDLVGGSWTQVGADIDGEAANDDSGISVALSSDGSRVAIGAALNDGNGNISGHVRIYDLVGGSWTQVGDDIDGEAAGDRSGRAIALSSDGSRIVIGAAFNNGNGTSSGHVRIFDFVDETWTQVGSDIDGEAADDGSGFSVALSSDGGSVAIGARFNNGNGSNAGHVRVFGLPFLVHFSIKAILQGAYNATTNNLRDDLRQLSDFPTTEPYSDLGYNITENPGLIIDPTILSEQVNENENIVDWMYLELRDINDQLSKSKVALIRKDGLIIDPGSTIVSFYAVAGDYRLVLKHRNHLGMMTQEFFSIPAQP